MKHSKKFREIWVSTDSHMIANEATKCGAKVHWRSRMSATDTASSLVALQDFIKGHKEFDRIGLIQCTSPFLAVKYLNEAFEHLQQGYDSVFSVTREFKLRWKENRPEKTFVAVNFDPARRPRRQDWDGELVENGMFYFTRRHLISRGLIQGGRIGVVQVERKDSLEVDNPADLNLARYQSGDL
ncbi:Hypothetical predicted protein [Cloeon dipterum]|nr:Hypothetical predicted protein [Cloeon dipterum]